jgi:hypothetical protein
MSIERDFDQVLKMLNPKQRELFLQKMSARSVRDTEVEEKLRRALVAAGVDRARHDAIVSACDAEGLFPDREVAAVSASASIDKLAAAAERNPVALRAAMGLANHFGINLRGGNIDRHDLDVQLRAARDRGMTIEKSISFKAGLAACGLID